ncbi:hypothetical protein D3C77_771990 [compost metagenome]
MSLLLSVLPVSIMELTPTLAVKPSLAASYSLIAVTTRSNFNSNPSERESSAVKPMMGRVVRSSSSTWIELIAS